MFRYLVRYCPGITPANTGRIAKSTTLTKSVWDHPREYGENVLEDMSRLVDLGSSPRIRGEWGKENMAHRRRGIIPANTGRIVGALESHSAAGIIPANTGRIVLHLTQSLPRRDHPREYGENVRLLAFWLTGVGSSPRIRGECYGDSPGSG